MPAPLRHAETSMADDLTTRLADPARNPVHVYASPRLVVYWSLVEITRKVGSKSNLDGGAVLGMRRSI